MAEGNYKFSAKELSDFVARANTKEISDENPNSPDRTLLERLVTALDKPASATRLAGAKAFGLEPQATFQDVLLKNKEYSARDLLNDTSKTYGVDLELGGKDEGYSKLDSIGNFVTELGVNIATDPLTYVGGNLFKGAAKAAEGMGFAKDTAKLLGRAAVGAGYGVLASGDKDNALGVAGNIAIGATTLGLGGPALRKVGEAASKVGGQLVDVVQTGLHPEVFTHKAVKELNMGYNEAWTTAKQARDRLAFVQRETEKLNRQMIEGMTPEQMDVVSGFVNGKYLLFTNYRNELELNGMKNQIMSKIGPDKLQAKMQKLDEHLIKNGSTMNPDEVLAKQIETLKGLGAKQFTDDELSAATRMVNNRVFKETEVELAKLGDPRLIDDVAKHITRNRKIISDYNVYNKAMFGDAVKEVVPIDFHTFEVLDADEIIKSIGSDTFNVIREGFVRRSSDTPIRTGGLALDERLQMESERLASAYMTKDEKAAQKLVSLVNQNVPTNPTAKAIVNFFDKYDTFTNFIKAQHLFFSHNWIVNNYSENVVRAYMDGGTGNAWKTFLNQNNAVVRNLDDALTRDLTIITNPKAANKGLEFSNDLMNVALDYGAIEKGFYQEVVGKDVSPEFLIAKKGVNGAKEAIAQQQNKTFIGDFQDFLKSTVGQTGAMVEGASRYTSFKYNIDKLLSSPEALASLNVVTDPSVLKQAMQSPQMRQQVITIPEIGRDLDKVFKNAAELTGEMFFNYQNVNVFEQKVMKRMFPYWTFFSRNAPFWLDKAAERPDVMSAIMNVNKSTGKQLTEQERAGMPDYMLKTVPRSLGDGKYVSMPNISLIDASTTTEAIDESYAKLHPAIKLVADLASGTDSFGGKLLPSENKNREKKAPSSATKFEPFMSSLQRDQLGNLQVTSDPAQLLITAQQALLPVGAVDTLVNAISRTRQGKTTPSEELMNLGPIKTRTLSPQEQYKTMGYRENKRRSQEKKSSIDRIMENIHLRQAADLGDDDI